MCIRDRNRVEENRKHLKPLIRDVVHQDHYDRTYHQDDGMLCDGSPVVATFISQRTGSTKHLYDRDEAEAKENNPDYLITFEYIL